MTSTVDPTPEREPALHAAVAESCLDRRWSPAILAVAGLAVALVAQFAIVAGAQAGVAAVGFAPAVLLFACAAVSMHRRRADAAAAAPFGLSRRWEIALLLAVVALAAFFRFFRFTEFPPGLWYDEAVNGVDALWIMDHSHITVWRPTNAGRSTLYFYLLIASFKTFGFTVFAFRIVPALAGLAAVVAFYALARWLVGPVAALVATALLAVSRYAVTFSRISWEASLQPLLEVMAVFFFVRGLETKSRFSFFMAGGSLAAGMYTYVGFRFVIVVIAFFLAYLAVTQRNLLRDNVRGLAIYAVAFTIVIAPLGQFAIRHPDAFLERTRETNVFDEIDREGDWAPLRHNIAATVKMANVAGDENGRHNLPGAPMLDGVSAALLVLGIAVSAWSIRNWRYGVILGWLVLAVVPGALTLSHENPSGIRDLGAIPPAFLLTGLAVSVVHRSMSVTRAGAAAFAAIALGLVAAAAAINYEDFFNKQAHSQAVYDAFGPQTTFIGQSIADHAGEADVYAEEGIVDTPAIVVLTRGKPWRMYDAARDFVLPSTGRDTFMILNERQFGAVPALQALYPNLVQEDDADPYGRVMFTRVTIPATDIDALHRLTLTVHDGETPDGAVLASGPSTVARDWSDADLGSAGVVTAVWEGYLWSGRAIASGELRIDAPGDVTIAIDGKTVAFGGPRAEARRLRLGIGEHAVRVVAVIRGAGATSIAYGDERGASAPAAASVLYGTSVADRGFAVTWHEGEDFAGDEVARGRLPFAIGANAENDGRAVEYRGVLDVAGDGEYGFELHGENRAQLLIDGGLVVEIGGAQGARVATGAVLLAKGPHDVIVRYVIDRWPDWGLFWKPPFGDWTRMDGSEFSPPSLSE